MNLWAKIFGRQPLALPPPAAFDPQEIRDLTPLQDLTADFFGRPSSREDAAMRQNAVWDCVTLLGDSVAQVPRHVFRRLEDGQRLRLRNHPVARVLRNPNPNMSSFTYWRTTTMHLVGWGNAFSVITRDAAGSVVRLDPIHPARVDIEELSDGSFRYVVNPEASLLTGRVAVRSPVPRPELAVIRVSSEDMLHIVDKTFDGRIGVSPLRLHALSIQSAQNQEDYSAAYYKNAPRMSGFVETDRALGVPETKLLRDRFKELFSRGAVHEASIAILTNGLKFNPLTTVNPADADYVNSRKLSTAEIAAIFRVPTTFLNQLDAATYDNVLNLSLGFVRFTLTPYFRNIEEELGRKLIRARDRSEIFVEHQAAALLRSTVKERYEAYRIALAAGFLTGNEVRSLENLPPLEGLDEPRVPLNTAPASEANTPGEDEPDEDEDEPDETIRMSLLRGLP